MKRLRLFVVAAVAVGAMAVAPAASAQTLDENCVGAEGVLVLCVDPTGRVIYSTCVYTGGTSCQPVSVPGPDFTRCDIGPNNPPSLLMEVIEGLCESL
jgi:hypothetical protein